MEPDTCGLQEGANFSVLSLPPKGQVWDCSGLVESVHVHCLSDALGPHPLHSWYYIARDTFDCWIAGPTPQAAKAFFAAVDSPVVAQEILAGGQ